MFQMDGAGALALASQHRIPSLAARTSVREACPHRRSSGHQLLGAVQISARIRVEASLGAFLAVLQVSGRQGLASHAFPLHTGRDRAA